MGGSQASAYFQITWGFVTPSDCQVVAREFQSQKILEGAQNFLVSTPTGHSKTFMGGHISGLTGKRSLHVHSPAYRVDRQTLTVGPQGQTHWQIQYTATKGKLGVVVTQHSSPTMTKADQLQGNVTWWLAESVNHGARLPGFKSLLHQGLHFSLLPFPIL